MHWGGAHGMGRGKALWNDRVFSIMAVCAWGSIGGIGESSYVGNEDRCARGMETNQKVNVLEIG